MPERRLRHRGDLRVVPEQVDAVEPAALRHAREHVDHRARLDLSLFRRDDVDAERHGAIVQRDAVLAEAPFLRVEDDGAHDADVRRRAEVHLRAERAAGQFGDARLIEIELHARGVVRRDDRKLDVPTMTSRRGYRRRTFPAATSVRRSDCGSEPSVSKWRRAASANADGFGAASNAFW